MFKFWQKKEDDGKKKLRDLQDKAGIQTGKAIEKADTLLDKLDQIHKDTVYYFARIQMRKAR